MTRITKVKNNLKTGKIHIEYEKEGVNGWDEYSLNCSDKAAPQFYSALSCLNEDVVEMCELPSDYINKINVSGVSYSYGGDKEVMGATIIATMILKKSNCDLNINTPHKASDSYSDTPADVAQLLTDDCVDRLNTLRDECIRYVDGDRAQMRIAGTV